MDNKRLASGLDAASARLIVNNHSITAEAAKIRTKRKDNKLEDL
jgi:hypothetical protein